MHCISESVKDLTPAEVIFGSYVITTDVGKMDIAAIHHFLSKNSDWSRDIPLEKVKKSMENSLNFGLLYKKKQIGFARVISDFSTIAYLGDVYILKNYRGFGLSKKMMDFIIAHPGLQGLRRWILLTSTAEWLYEKYGFTMLPKPEIYMEKFNPNVYLNKEKTNADI
ncbi:MAG: GNAT family N-acetyltransferase [Chloroflexia bacterium]|nr:GNAT family N-acetyltransferase [Chloroflexia bacterium]